MTSQHPLTDEIIEEIAEDVFYYDYSIPIFRCDMRSVADWELGQVIEWLRHNLGSVPLDPVGYSGHEIDVDYVIEDLREAMRPQGDN
jgi:hypothetical protein